MHGPSTQWKKDYSSTLKELLGKWFFFFYSVIYAGFIIINVLSPKFLATDIGSLNVAIVYGIGLIVLAMFMAFAYNHVATLAEELLNKDYDAVENGTDKDAKPVSKPEDKCKNADKETFEP